MKNDTQPTSNILSNKDSTTITDHRATPNVLFLCKCGSHVSQNVDFDEITAWAKSEGFVNVVAISNLLCAPQGQTFFSDVITERLQGRRANSIVVAACSPKMHEKTFQDLAEKAGYNMSQVQMANIREQCAWVTKDKTEATEKATLLINGAIQRSRFQTPLKRQRMSVNTNVVIIGGGMAGIEAARTFARAGRKVTIVDKEISIGGSVIKYDEVAPAMECAPCMLAPLLSEIRDDPNIEVITNAEVREILGFYGNFTVNILKKARYVRDNCIGCEECFAPCPVSVTSAFHANLGERKAIYTQFPGSVPAAAAIDADNCLYFNGGDCHACVDVCPFQSINFEDKDEIVSVEAGAVIFATGFDAPDMNKFPEYSYDLPNVLTSLEFERLASSNGPTGGRIKLANGKIPEKVAVLHCAGSLRTDGLAYCSQGCCVQALKVGDLVRKANPNAKVINYHHDMVLPSLADAAFYHEQREKTQFKFTADLRSIKIKAGEAGSIELSENGQSSETFDMIVLATGMAPNAGIKRLIEQTGIELNSSNYMVADHSILHSTGTRLDGIYMAGAAASPGNVPRALDQARSAAGHAMSKLVPGQEIELEIMTSFILEEQCAGCKLCISVCPYKAISFLADKKISYVNEAICRGCGTCTAACPSGASVAKNFTDQQIFAEIGGMLYV